MRIHFSANVILLMKQFELTFKPSVLHNTKRIVITNELISYNELEEKNTQPVLITSTNLSGIRYGIKWIKGYKFYIGRIYCIDILRTDNEVLKLRLKSVYRIRLHKLNDKYHQILTALYDFFFNDLIEKHLGLFLSNQPFELGGVRFTPEGIVLVKHGLIIWDDVALKQYSHYFSIFSKKESHKNAFFEFSVDWNSPILFTVIGKILTLSEQQRL